MGIQVMDYANKKIVGISGMSHYIWTGIFYASYFREQLSIYTSTTFFWSVLGNYPFPYPGPLTPN